MKLTINDFIVSEDAWCEHCGELAKGRCAHGHPALGVSAEADGVQYCPSCCYANGYISKQVCEKAWNKISEN